MYIMKYLEDLEIGDKAIIIVNAKPIIVTVEEIDLPDGSFLIEESDLNFYVNPIAVVDEE